MKYQISNFKIKIEERAHLLPIFLRKYHLKDTDIIDFYIQKESIDARDKGKIVIAYNLLVETKKRLKGPNVKLYDITIKEFSYPKWKHKHRPVIVGFGPAGIFAALYLARAKANPIIIERGGDMDSRILDVEKFLKDKLLDEKSNIQFGEGGAGTFSDGKLTTNTKDPLINFILDEFIKYGAPKEIRYASMPHIGTDYLRKVIKNMRKDMETLGAQFHFKTTFTNFIKDNDNIIVKTTNGDFLTNHLILALGHSARDTFKMLYQNQLHLEPKSFSIGVRIEHKREKINEIQYGNYHQVLPAASYKLSVHLKERSVYSFCMCPGGEVMASQSEADSIVTNGMSYYDRAKDNSNAALLVNIDPRDYYHKSPLDGMYFQEKYERLAFAVSKDYKAPANLVKEFLENKVASNYRSVVPSYPHGVCWCDLHQVLPPYVVAALQEAIPLMDKKMHGYNDDDAVLTGVETRSSSPIRIIRNENRMASVAGIYPVGEGAGYAGGIMTAALDGLKTALLINEE